MSNTVAIPIFAGGGGGYFLELGLEKRMISQEYTMKYLSQSKFLSHNTWYCVISPKLIAHLESLNHLINHILL